MMKCNPRVVVEFPMVFFPRSNKRCFLNGLFQSGVFRGWSGSASAEGTKMLENTSVFRVTRFIFVASYGQESEKHRLEPLP